MPLPRVLVLVLAGGAGSRLELLTEDRAKAAVPFAGAYRLIDFPLSSCQHSHLSDVWVAMQYNPTSLASHLANGRPWDLDRTQGGLLALQPARGTDREGWHSGTADSLWRNAPQIRQFAPDALVVLSADAVYRMDYRDVVDGHLQGGADATLVTTRVAAEEAGRYGVVQVRDGVVSDYAHKPDDPEGDLVVNEVLVLDAVTVLDRLEALADDAGEEGLQDLGHALLPELVADGSVREHRFEGYWRDVGTVDAYWRSNMEFLDEDPPIDLDDPGWRIGTRGGLHSAARVLPGAVVDRSLLAGGLRVAGTVRGSVLSPGVRVDAGAVVEDSVLLPDVHVRAGAHVRRTVVDSRVTVGADAQVGGHGDITLVGGATTVPDGAYVPAGGRYPEPGDG